MSRLTIGCELVVYEKAEGRIKTHRGVFIGIDIESGRFIIMNPKTKRVFSFELNYDIGKTVFFTREAAEKALQEVGE